MRRWCQLDIFCSLLGAPSIPVSDSRIGRTTVVVGESQILGQVRDAWEVARDVVFRGLREDQLARLHQALASMKTSAVTPPPLRTRPGIRWR